MFTCEIDNLTLESDSDFRKDRELNSLQQH